MKKLTSIFVIGFLLIGCASKVIVMPDQLPDAVVGKPYYMEIQIKGGAVSPTILGLVKSENGLVVEPIEKNVGYNTIKIYGKPLKAEDTTILIRGSTYGTMVPGTKFEKTYVIKVKEAE